MNPSEQRSEAGDPTPESNGQTLGTIALRQVRVSRAEVQEKSNDANPMNRLVPYLDLYGRLSDDELTKLTGVPVAMVSNLRRQVVQVDRALSRFTDLLPRLTDAEMVRLTGATPKTVRFWRLCQPRFGMGGAGADGWSVAQAAETLGRVGSSAELTHHSGGNGSGSGDGGGGSGGARSTGETPIDSGVPLDQHPTGEMPRQPSKETRRASESGIHAQPRPDSRRSSESGIHAQPRPDSRRGSESGIQPAVDAPRRHSSGEVRAASSAYRMPTAERDGGHASKWAASRTEAAKPPPPPKTGVRIKPRRGSTQEVPAAASTPPVPTGAPEHPDTRFRQKAVSKQMSFDGAPFPGYDSHAPVDVQEDDGIFIGLELPDPRTLAQPGRPD